MQHIVYTSCKKYFLFHLLYFVYRLQNFNSCFLLNFIGVFFIFLNEIFFIMV